MKMSLIKDTEILICSRFLCNYLSYAGDEVVSDISPSSGQLYFVSNEAHQYLIVDVVQDHHPEGLEVGFLPSDTSLNIFFVHFEFTLFSIYLHVYCRTTTPRMNRMYIFNLRVLDCSR